MSSARETAEAILENHGEVCETYQVAKTFRDAHVKLCDELTAAQETLDALNDDDTVTGSDEVYTQADARFYALETDIEDLEAEFETDIAHEYAKLWSKETSEEAIKESIEANEREFLADGRSPRF